MQASWIIYRNTNVLGGKRQGTGTGNVLCPFSFFPFLILLKFHPSFKYTLAQPRLQSLCNIKTPLLSILYLLFVLCSFKKIGVI
jgi:hypothetical protein